MRVYINQPQASTTPDATITYRSGSPMLSVLAGESISVRARFQNPPPIPNLPQEYTFTVPPVPPGQYVISLSGVPEPLLTSYAANPAGLSTLLQLVTAQLTEGVPGMSRHASAQGAGGGVPVTITHAVTDAPDLDVVLMPSGQVLADNLSYGDAAENLTLAPGLHRLQVRRASDQAQLAVVEFMLDGTEGVFPLTIAGFLDPAANQNGPPLTLTATDSTGTTDAGIVLTGTETAPRAGPSIATANPARAGSAVRFTVPTAGTVRLSVLDMIGREVATLVDGERGVGAHLVPFPDGLSPGTYIVRLTTAAGTFARQVTAIR